MHDVPASVRNSSRRTRSLDRMAGSPLHWPHSICPGACQEGRVLELNCPWDCDQKQQGNEMKRSTFWENGRLL